MSLLVNHDHISTGKRSYDGIFRNIVSIPDRRLQRRPWIRGMWGSEADAGYEFRKARYAYEKRV